MSSNYPPGVTGNEPEIIGCDEHDAKPRCRVCGRELAHEPGLGGLPDLCLSCWAAQTAEDRREARNAR